VVSQPNLPKPWRIKRVTASFLKAGLITAVQQRALLNQAAQSSCGKR
jgi:hypothetical protein